MGAGARTRNPVRPREGYLFVADEQQQYALLPITLKLPVFSVSAQEQVMPLLQAADREARGAAGAGEDRDNSNWRYFARGGGGPTGSSRSFHHRSGFFDWRDCIDVVEFSFT